MIFNNLRNIEFSLIGASDSSNLPFLEDYLDVSLEISINYPIIDVVIQEDIAVTDWQVHGLSGFICVDCTSAGDTDYKFMR